MLGGGDASGVKNEEDEALIYSRIDTQTTTAWDAGITPRVSGELHAHDLAVTAPEIKVGVMGHIVSACIVSLGHGNLRVTYPRR